MKRLIKPWLLALCLAVLALPAAAQQRAYAPEDLRSLSYQDQVRVISMEYEEQSYGRRIPDDQLQFYLDQVNRSRRPQLAIAARPGLRRQQLFGRIRRLRAGAATGTGWPERDLRKLQQPGKHLPRALVGSVAPVAAIVGQPALHRRPDLAVTGWPGVCRPRMPGGVCRPWCHATGRPAARHAVSGVQQRRRASQGMPVAGGNRHAAIAATAVQPALRAGPDLGLHRERDLGEPGLQRALWLLTLPARLQAYRRGAGAERPPPASAAATGSEIRPQVSRAPADAVAEPRIGLPDHGPSQSEPAHPGARASWRQCPSKRPGY